MESTTNMEITFLFHMQLGGAQPHEVHSRVTSPFVRHNGFLALCEVLLLELQAQGLHCQAQL